MVFTYSLDDFAVTFFVTGNGSQRLPVRNLLVRAKESTEINALSTLMFLFLIILVIGYYFIQNSNKNE